MHPPAWHADPTAPGQERWWDGRSFTDDVRPAAPLAVVVPGAAWSPAGPAAAPGYGAPAAAYPAPQHVPRPAPQDVPGPARPAPQDVSGAAPLRPGEAPRGLFADVQRQADIRADLASGKNSHANLGFLLALLSVIGFAPGWVAGVIFGVLGLRRAGQYAAAGYPATGRTKAVWALALSVVGFTITCLLVLSGLPDGRPDLTSTEVEGVVAGQLAEQTGSAADVDCPGTSALGTGDKLSCTAAQPDGTQHAIEVSVHDDEGLFTWRGEVR